MITCVIVDDEQQNISILKKIISKVLPRSKSDWRGCFFRDRFETDQKTTASIGISRCGNA